VYKAVRNIIFQYPVALVNLICVGSLEGATCRDRGLLVCDVVTLL
jgi:uncharacterized membrane protein